jgi:hypothetical protein
LHNKQSQTIIDTVLGKEAFSWERENGSLALQMIVPQSTAETHVYD